MENKDLIRDPGLAEESARAEKPLRDIARKESLSLTAEEKAVFDRAAKKLGGEKIQEIINIAAESAYAEKPLRDFARDESLGLSEDDKKIIDQMAERAGRRTVIGNESEQYEILPEETTPQPEIGSEVWIARGTSSGTRGIFSKIGEAEVFYAGKPLILDANDKEHPERIADDITCVVPITWRMLVGELRPGARVMTVGGKKGTVTDTAPTGESIIKVLMDDGSYWDASQTAEVTILSNPQRSRKN